MRIKQAEYVCSFPSLKSIKVEPLPAFAFIGRSNVGKSSLINHLVDRKRLVKTSGLPGKTQLINFFLINQSFYFVDLPGYGFATAPKAVKDSWMRMIWEFLQGYGDLSLVFQILDLRHLPSKEDFEFNQGLQQAGLPFALIGNKTDKLGKNQIQSQAAKIRKAIGAPEPLLLHSSLDKVGKPEILSEIQSRLDLLTELE